ncbi:PAS domain S-box protein [Persicimonas caeni]|uniref:Sensor protein FixL n=1 Tax=Persicimonas caeni TaxID=2292766 RepID=A0A4Y6PMI2_PERCE|nr:PAS domain-containing sensor histidine kinase [Persicimonas caeni]QDG49524.1 PAS domain S-box protein [Persicimonas caeni]QED30745.1 PAS domain S-box protein [Persicimonas caeni]
MNDQPKNARNCPAPEATNANDTAYAAAHLEAIFESVVDGVITIDSCGYIHSFNPAAEGIFGYAADEVVGEKINMLMPQPFRREHDAYMERYQETGEKRIIGIGREVKGLRKDGSVFPLDLAVSEFWVGDNRFYSGIVRDITDRREARKERERLIQELGQKNAELERFTYTVSHDLKSPLITIKGFLGMLEQDMKAGNYDRMSSDMVRIANAADKMKELLDEVLELSRIGRVVNPSEWVDLEELASEVATLLSGPIEQNGVTVEISPELPTVYGDRIRLQEVLQNLIENAIKFMGDQDEPKIVIDSYRDEDEVVCCVQDNGIGISPDYLKKVFGLFEQLDPTKQGTGVGLALVHRIIEVHGGRIWVESAGIDEGSRFCFTFPPDKTRA